LQGEDGELFPKRSFNLVPFRRKFIILENYTRFVISPGNLEFYKDLIGNILLFVLFPFTLLCFGVTNYRWLLLVSIGASLSVEIIQYLFNIGVADIDDLILKQHRRIYWIAILYPFSRIKNNKPILQSINLRNYIHFIYRHYYQKKKS